MMKNKFFTIITISYNCSDDLLKTIRSVTSQDCDDVEFIIIDGGSNDNTIDILTENENNIDTIVSESDNGIYDAMNKGASLAHGRYVLYMNSGDIFYSESVLSKIKDSIINSNYPVIIYGDSISDYIYKKVYKRALEKDEFMKKYYFSLGFSHQSVFVDRNVLGSNPFDLHFKVAADFNFLYPLLRKYNDNILRVNMPISIFSIGGVSDLDKIILNKEKKIIYNANNTSSLISNMYFLYLLNCEKIKRKLRKHIRKFRI